MRKSAVNRYVSDFLEYLDIEKGVSPATIRAYQDDLKLFFRFLGERHGLCGAEEGRGPDLKQVTSLHIRGFLAYLKSERLNCNKTLARRLTTLRSFFSYLERSEVWALHKNPAARFGSIRYERKLPPHLTLEEAEVFLETVRQKSRSPERDRAIFLLFLQACCRLSEVKNLKLSDILPDFSKIKITGKGAKQRIVPLTPNTAEALKTYLAVRKPAKDTTAVFLSQRGRPFSSRGLDELFRRTVARSPLKKPGLSIHKLRHTGLMLLLKAGVDIRTLRDIAGHTNVAATQIYTHLTAADIQQEMLKHPLG